MTNEEFEELIAANQRLQARVDEMIDELYVLRDKLDRLIKRNVTAASVHPVMQEILDHFTKKGYKP